MMVFRKGFVGAWLAVLCGAAPAYELEFGENDAWKLELHNRITLGTGWRAESPDPDLIAKVQLDPQLCAADDCIALTPENTAPNARYLAAPGAMQSFTDDTEMNYDKGDIWAAAGKLTSRLLVGTKNYGLSLGLLYFYDPVNQGFKEKRFNQILRPGPGPGQPVEFQRDKQIEKDIGTDLQVLDANIFYRFPIWNGSDAEVRIGRQNLVWGEAALSIQGTVNVINPPDANNLARPGFQFDEIYRPVNLVTLNAQLTEALSAEAFYQLEWRPYGFPAKGSYFSFFDAGNEVTENEHIPVLFGKNGDDPLQQQRIANPLARLLTSTSLSILRGPNREPPDTGQYGLSLSYFLEGVHSAPIVLNAYYANYHSRLPSASATAAAASCARREGNPFNDDATNAVELFNDCGLTIDPSTLTSVLGAVGLGTMQPQRITERDALPVDTPTYFLDYPEDIELFGLSFNTEVAGLALQGELAYRPNQPVQVDLEDVLFAAFQPALPRQSIEIAPGIATLAGSQVAIPDFITAYRGGTPGEVAPRSYIQGFERMEEWHPTLAFTKVTGARDWFRATEGIYLLEFSADYLPDLPDLEVLQFQGPGTDTHHSPGIAETGNALKFNPIATNEGFVTKFSWGYRAAILLRYADVLMQGLSLRPLLIFTHDVKGTGPGLAENFVEGRKLLVPNLQFQYRDFRADLIYFADFGGGAQNTLRDRDAYAVQFSYAF